MNKGMSTVIQCDFRRRTRSTDLAKAPDIVAGSPVLSYQSSFRSSEELQRLTVAWFRANVVI
jgi:hypothetical protein